MSERVDRRVAKNNGLLFAVIIIFTFAAAAGLFFWKRVNVSSGGQGQAQTAQPSQIFHADQPAMFTVFYPVAGVLAAGAVPAKRKSDAQTEIRDILLSVLADQRFTQSPVFSQLRLREFFLDGSGTGYADFSPVSQNGVKASTSDELLAIYAVVDTLTQNFEEIKHVRFLIDGKEAQTLAGHIDLTRNFEKRMDLVK